MNTITAIIEPSPDGTLHVPLPAEWRNLPIRIKAELEPAETVSLAVYSAEWLEAFGSIADTAFETPTRDLPRPVEPIDAE